MLIIVQTNYGEFSVILRNENFRVSLCLQEVLEYLKFYETTTKSLTVGLKPARIYCNIS